MRLKEKGKWLWVTLVVGLLAGSGCLIYQADQLRNQLAKLGEHNQRLTKKVERLSYVNDLPTL